MSNPNPFDSIRDEIISCFKNENDKLHDKISKLEPVKETRYLTREDVSNMLQISESTVFNWTKNGTLKAYQIVGRIYYKLHEIEAAFVELKK